MIKKMFYISLLACFLNADCRSDLDKALKDVDFPIVNEKITLENIFCDGELIQINFIIPDNLNFKKEKVRNEFKKEFIDAWREKYCFWGDNDDLLEAFKDREWLLEVRTKSGSFTFWQSFNKNQCK